MVMRLQAFFVEHTGIQIPTLHIKMLRETLNPHIGTVTSNSNFYYIVIYIKA